MEAYGYIYIQVIGNRCRNAMMGIDAISYTTEEWSQVAKAESYRTGNKRKQKCPWEKRSKHPMVQVRLQHNQRDENTRLTRPRRLRGA
jgi:hypothetical protein